MVEPIHIHADNLDRLQERAKQADCSVDEVLTQLLDDHDRLQSLESYIDVIPNVMLTIDEQSIIRQVNATIEVMFGYTPDEITGQSLSILVPEHLQSIHAEHVKAYFQNPFIRPIGLAGNLYGRRKNGEIFPIDVGLSYLEQDGVIHSVVVVADMTRRLQAEQTYRSVVDNSLQGIMILQDGRPVFVNPAITELTGYTVEEYLKMSSDELSKITHPDDRKLIAQRMADRHAGKSVDPRLERRIIHKDGTIRWIESFAAEVTYAGKPAFQVAYVDITARKQAEELLRKSEQRLRLMVETQSAFVARIDLDGNYRYVNQAFYERYKWMYPDRDAIIGSSVLATVAEDEHEKVLDAIEHIIKDPGQSRQITIQKLAEQGNTFWTLWEFVGIQDADGQTIEIQCMGFDITEQKLNENKLIDQGNTLAISLKAAQAGVWIWDIDANTLTWDKQMRVIYGIEDDHFDVDYEGWLSVIHPDDRQKTHAQVQLALNSNEQFNSEFRIIRSDGKIRHILGQGIIVHDENTGQSERMIGLNMDITERKQIEERLRYQAAIYQSISDAVITLDLDMKIMTWNDSAKELYGWDAKDVIGKVMSEVIPITYPDTTSEEVDKIFYETGQWNGEVIQIARNGKLVHVLGSLSQVIDQSGRAIGVVAVAKDITDYKKSQTRLAKALESERDARLHEMMFRNTAETLSNMSDFQNALQKASVNLKQIVDYDELIVHQNSTNQFEMILYQNMMETNYNPILNQLIMSLFDRARNSNKPIRLSHIKDVTFFKQMDDMPKDLVAVPLVARGITIGLLTVLLKTTIFTPHNIKAIETFANQIAIAMDNTQVLIDLENSYNRLRMAQENMVHSARLSAIGELAAGIAHQINNPLMTVIGDSYLLMKLMDKESPTWASAEAIHRSAQRAGDVVQRLLDFSRNQNVKMSRHHINQSLENAISLVRSQIEPHYAEIHTTLSSNLPEVDASEDHLLDIWINLLLNARDAVRDVEYGVIEVTSHLNVHDGVIEVIITDNGTGIGVESLSNIFDPFFTTKTNGTGLGLAISADIVKQHKGTISVDSIVGEGTMFTVRLPIAGT